MSRHDEFKMETRPYGDGCHTNFVQIVCGYCGYDEWHAAKDGGWAIRVFRAKGWKVGSKAKQNRCPKCLRGAIASRRKPDNPAIPPEVGKMIKASIVDSRNREALMGTTVLYRDPVMETVIIQVDDLAPGTPLPDAPPEPAPAPPVAPAWAKRGSPSLPGVTVHPKLENAVAAAVKATGSWPGAGFFTVPAPPGFTGGWMWKLAADTTPEEQAAWRASRKYGARPIKRTKTRPEPVATIVTPVVNEAGVRIAVKEETIMAVKPTITQQEPMPQTNVTTLPTRQPTRDERNTIHEALTACYEIADQRYAGSHSDQLVAERLNVPRIWVTDIRVAFFGDHDRNSMTEKRKKDLDATIVLASAAAKRLLEMAAEADTLESTLRAARKTLEG